MQNANILSIDLTLDILKFDKSINFSLEQLKNNKSKLSTDEVSIFPKFIDSKFWQWQNIRSNVLTLEVLKLDISIDFKLEQ